MTVNGLTVAQTMDVDRIGQRKSNRNRVRVIVDLYSALSLKRSGMARVNEDSHSFTCHPRVYS